MMPDTCDPLSLVDSEAQLAQEREHYMQLLAQLPGMFDGQASQQVRRSTTTD